MKKMSWFLLIKWVPISSKSPHLCRWIAIFRKSVIKPAINHRFPLNWRLISGFPLKITENRDSIDKNRQFQRFHRDLLARLTVRLYRDKIVDFHQTLYIANTTEKRMISFMFSSDLISSSTCRRDEPLSLLYSLLFNGLYLFPFDSTLSFEQETWAQRSRGGPYIVYLMPATVFMKILSFLMHVYFFEKIDQKIVTILRIYHDISRYVSPISCEIKVRPRRSFSKISDLFHLNMFW